MKRRKAVSAHPPPPELVRFDLERWAAMVVVEDPLSGGASLRTALAACRAWCDARGRYEEQHGWHTDPVDRLREQRAIRRALMRDLA